MTIKAGCVVFHDPTQEEWFVLGVSPEGDRLCIAGYPPTIANTSDCKLVKECKRSLTDNEINYRHKTFGSGWQ